MTRTLVFILLCFGIHSWADALSAGIVEENSLPGTGAWTLVKYDASRLEAFGSATSVGAGEQIRFFANTPARQFQVDVYRLGWYGGPGGRLYSASGPLTGRVQPPCAVDPATGLQSCSTWEANYVLNIPKTWLSGAYWAKFTELDAGFETAVLFVVRNDDSTASLLVQIPFATYQAYNSWGGKSLYEFNSADEDENPLGERAYKVSFDRPYRDPFAQLMQDEYPAVRWLEREGFDVTYSTSIDTHARPDLLLRHNAWITLGHDEYWSREMRDNLEAARDRGVHLGFFGGNIGYWQVRFEASAIGANRVMVCYKSAVLDPYATGYGTPLDTTRVTVAFRDSPVDRPENSLIGVMWGDLIPYGAPLYDWVAANTNHWVFEGTSMQPGDRIPTLVGYEFDWVTDNARSPAGLTVLSRSPACATPGPCDQFANSTIYEAPSGAWVFAAGTIEWAWHLDSYRPWCGERCPESTDPRVARITANVLRRFQGQPPERLQLSQTFFDFQSSPGVSPASLSLRISQDGNTPLAWAASLTGTFASWLKVSSLAGLTPANLSVTADTSNLNPGEYHAAIVVVSPLGLGVTNSPATIDVTLRVAAPAIQAGGIVDGAAFSPQRPVAPGSLVSLFGTGLATSITSASVVPLPARLDSTEVLVNGVPAPLFFVSPLQINFQMPFEVMGSTAAIAVRVNGLVSANVTVRLEQESPAIFLTALNEDGTVNTGQNPARPASVIQLFATSLGAVRPALASGSPGASAEPLNRAAVPVRVLIEGRESEVLFAGLAPGLVAVYQVNVRLPPALASGNVPVKILGGATGSESNTVTIWVQ